MRIFKLIFRNALRHKLRSALTIIGMAIAVMAFAVIRTSIEAWYAQAKASSPNRLVTINAISLTFDMPLSYERKIAEVPGVKLVSHAQWFGGVYVDPRNFFPQFMVEPKSYFEMCPEFVVPPDQFDAFVRERNSAIIGRKLADRFGWKIGDAVRLAGTIFPGDWDFVIRGIYTGAKENTDESTWFSNFAYLDERMRTESPGRAGRTGSFIVQIDDPTQSANVSEQIDALFKNSMAETKTQTEEAFSLSFVAMAGSIVSGLRIISFMVIGIILLVLANTMAMTARERVNEYAVLKTLGFRPFHLIGLIFGESMFIACLGAALGIFLTVPSVWKMREALSDFFPVLPLPAFTFILAGSAAIAVGLIAAIFPAIKAMRTSIVDGLRTID